MNKDTGVPTAKVMTPGACLYPPSFVLALGQCLHNVTMGGGRLLESDEAVVNSIRSLIDSLPIDSPERSYLTMMLGQALAVARGLRSKIAKREELLREARRKRAESEERQSRREESVGWLKATGKMLMPLAPALLAWLSFMLFASATALDRSMSGQQETYWSLVVVIATVLVSASVRSLREERFKAMLSAWYEAEMNAIWEEYRQGAAREYGQALDVMDCAWFLMMGTEPPQMEGRQALIKVISGAGEVSKQRKEFPRRESFLRELAECACRSAMRIVGKQ